jgi:hypothetical protein
MGTLQHVEEVLLGSQLRENKIREIHDDDQYECPSVEIEHYFACHMPCHVHYCLSFLQQAKHVRFLTANCSVNITFTHDYLSHCKSLYINHKLTT